MTGKLKRDWSTAEIEALHRADTAQKDLQESLGFESLHREEVARLVAEYMGRH